MMPQRRDVREVIREEPLRRREIQAMLADGAKTIPEISAQLGYPSEEILYWIMGMRKYGYVAEVPEVTEDGYYRYRNADREAF
jgi:predicted transcriptional regulator